MRVLVLVQDNFVAGILCLENRDRESEMRKLTFESSSLIVMLIFAMQTAPSMVAAARIEECTVSVLL